MDDMHEYIIKTTDHPLTSTWSYEESAALIDSVESHYNEMHHPLKRKNLWNVVSSELEGLDYIRNPIQCRDKWRNLLRTYKSCKENINKTGRGPTRFDYFNKMDAFLGQDVNIYSNVTVERPVIGRIDKNRKKRLIQHHHLAVTPERISPALSNYLAFKIDYLKKKEEEKFEERIKRQERHNEKIEILTKAIDIFKEKH